ncbi:hypothetical protein SAMD00019534_104560 [Acytostelium subglobosum LB1]|uniref:hypothetical protein n=1 Tax=Acytostelium subglobosum LB1 TaxID=1410327 RepID=UPI000644B8A0|nr:hypothetical protein SAMD00019534_104560 [Acytostelium subglobosum LB1]GAM27281.1 hypothetical protein SAMD00019534_104560 [Acytostelium subglobosum LB1]|eukprot:XP_012749748.1 hypothetical protein SAMD00019534_104560 [Acytostelium subglobosum LB1]
MGGGPSKDADPSFEEARREFKETAEQCTTIHEALKKRDKNAAKLFNDPKSLNKALVKFLPDNHPLNNYSGKVSGSMEDAYLNWLDSNKPNYDSLNRAMSMIKSIKDGITSRDNLLMQVEQSDQKIKALRKSTSADFSRLTSEEQANKAKKQAFLTKNYNTLLDVHNFFKEKNQLFDMPLMRIQESQSTLYQTIFNGLYQWSNILQQQPPYHNPIDNLLPEGPPNLDNIQIGPDGPQPGNSPGQAPQRPARLNNSINQTQTHRPSPLPPSIPSQQYSSPPPVPPHQQQPPYSPPMQQQQQQQQAQLYPQPAPYMPTSPTYPQQYPPSMSPSAPPATSIYPTPQQYYAPQPYQPQQQQQPDPMYQPPPPPRPQSYKQVPVNINSIGIDSDHHQQAAPQYQQYQQPLQPQQQPPASQVPRPLPGNNPPRPLSSNMPPPAYRRS